MLLACRVWLALVAIDPDQARHTVLSCDSPFSRSCNCRNASAVVAMLLARLFDSLQSALDAIATQLSPHTVERS